MIKVTREVDSVFISTCEKDGKAYGKTRSGLGLTPSIILLFTNPLPDTLQIPRTYTLGSRQVRELQPRSDYESKMSLLRLRFFVIH